MAVVPPLNIDLPTDRATTDRGHTTDHNATNTAINATADAVDALAEIARSGDLADAADLNTSAASTGQVVAVASVSSGRPTFDLVDPPEGTGGSSPPTDATTFVKGVARILGGSADAPTVPWSAVTGKPTIPDSPDDIGAQPAGSYATPSDLTSGLAGKAAVTHQHVAADLNLAGPVAIGGGDSGLSSLRVRGLKATAGAPTTGTYVAGDVVLDAGGAWHLCTTGGTPGTWLSLADSAVHVVDYVSGAYEPRPPYPAGHVRYIGPVQPTTWLDNDEWVQTS